MRPRHLKALRKRKGMNYWKGDVDVRGDSLDDYVDLGELLDEG